MSYKEKKLKEFDEEFEIYAYKPEALEFIAKTLDEIMACLPEEIDKSVYGENIAIGFHMCKTIFSWRLEQKAREV